MKKFVDVSYGRGGLSLYLCNDAMHMLGGERAKVFVKILSPRLISIVRGGTHVIGDKNRVYVQHTKNLIGSEFLQDYFGKVSCEWTTEDLGIAIKLPNELPAPRHVSPYKWNKNKPRTNLDKLKEVIAEFNHLMGEPDLEDVEIHYNATDRKIQGKIVRTETLE